MAFNFNWSPLIADTDRVRDMLTSSLNKSPKPPIIVDDIIVNELNLGSTPPELEILEVGDLAEDRFRGIFKMSYTGDAYLTLKTRVQANPLNTYLSTKPSFTSPRPLAASSGLTIPLQITLSDIRLSGFVILVFSKQKGITLVFRNDPLESLKVSSTFDSIPFIKDYLQKTIESQLRVLFMEDLPAIIHQLSLRLFSPEYQTAENRRPNKIDNNEGKVPESSSSTSPQPRTSTENLLDALGDLSLDVPTETYASFSQKNLLRLAALSESQRTLSLFTPKIPDTVFRAWACVADRNEASNGANTPSHKPTLSRIQSSLGTYSVMSSAASQASDSNSQAVRPGLASNASVQTVYSLNTGRPRTQRKRKNRIVNLRKNKDDKDVSDIASISSGYTDTASGSVSGSTGPSHAMSEPISLAVGLAREGEITTPPRSPRRVYFQQTGKETQADARPITPRDRHATLLEEDDDATPRASTVLPGQSRLSRPPLPSMQSLPTGLPRSASELSLGSLSTAFAEGSSGGILEQAWMMKMANEIARKVAEEKGRSGGDWRRRASAPEDGLDGTGDAPPAYVV